MGGFAVPASQAGYAFGGTLVHVNAAVPALSEGFAASGGGILAAAGPFALGGLAPLAILDAIGVTPSQIFQGTPSGAQFSKSAQSFRDTMLNSAKTLCSTKWTPSGTVALAPHEARACGIKKITDTYNSLRSGKQLPGSQFSNQEADQAYQDALHEWEATHPDVPAVTSSNALAHLASDYLPPLGAPAGGVPTALGLSEGIAAASGTGAALATVGGTAALVGAKALPGVLAAVSHPSPFHSFVSSGLGGSSLFLIALAGVALYLVLRKK